MKHPDFDKAFAPTPEIVSLSIEAAFRKGEKAMKFRHKLITALSAAAVLAVVCAAAVFALPNEPRPDVVSQPVLTEPTEEPTVYYTSKGIYYHNIQDCSGMMNAQPHPLSEAQSDGKLACSVCVSTDAVPASSLAEESTEMVFISYGDDRSATEIGADIFQNVFGVSMFDVLQDYQLTYTDAYDMVGVDDTFIQEIQLRFCQNGFSQNDSEFTPVIITIESKDEQIISGSIFLNFINFSGASFREDCLLWYQNVCESAAATLEGLDILGAGSGGMPELPLQLLVNFGSDLKPAVCTLEYECSTGFFTLSFDINGDDVSLASMNYNVSKA